MNRRVGKLLSISKLKDFSNNDCLSQLGIVTNSNELSQTLIIILSGRLILKLLFHLKRHEITRKKEHHFFVVSTGSVLVWLKECLLQRQNVIKKAVNQK